MTLRMRNSRLFLSDVGIITWTEAIQGLQKLIDNETEKNITFLFGFDFVRVCFHVFLIFDELLNESIVWLYNHSNGLYKQKNFIYGLMLMVFVM